MDKKLKQFKDLVEKLKSEGFDIPSFKFDNAGGIYHTDFGKRIDELDLSTRCLLELRLEFPKEAEVEEVLGYQTKINPFVGWSSFHYDNEQIDETPIEEWDDLPKVLKEEINFLNDLEKYLLSFPEESHPKSSRGTELLIGNEKWTYGRYYGSIIKDWCEIIKTDEKPRERFKWADIKGEKFPYVTTYFNEIREVGVSFGGLYFVSIDIANEPWKEQVVAYHERFCQYLGHDAATQRHLELVKELGKLEEYKLWMETLPKKDINGGK